MCECLLRVLLLNVSMVYFVRVFSRFMVGAHGCLFACFASCRRRKRSKCSRTWPRRDPRMQNPSSDLLLLSFLLTYTWRCFRLPFLCKTLPPWTCCGIHSVYGLSKVGPAFEWERIRPNCFFVRSWSDSQSLQLFLCGYSQGRLQQFLMFLHALSLPSTSCTSVTCKVAMKV